MNCIAVIVVRSFHASSVVRQLLLILLSISSYDALKRSRACILCRLVFYSLDLTIYKNYAQFFSGENTDIFEIQHILFLKAIWIAII